MAQLGSQSHQDPTTPVARLLVYSQELLEVRSTEVASLHEARSELSASLHGHLADDLPFFFFHVPFDEKIKVKIKFNFIF